MRRVQVDRRVVVNPSRLGLFRRTGLRLVEQRQVDQLAGHRELSIVHGEVAGDAVLVQLEADPVFRHLLAGLVGVVEIGDVDRPVFVAGELGQRRRFRIGLVAVGLLADDDGGGHHLVGVFRAVEEIGFIEIFALFRLADQLDQMLGRELGGGKLQAVLLGLVDIDLEALGLLRRGALDLLVEVLVDEGFGDEGEGLALGILEGGRLLVGQPGVVVGDDLGDEAELDRIALAWRAVELIHHAAGNAGDSRAIGGLAQGEIIDGPMRLQSRHGKGWSHREERWQQDGVEGKARCAHMVLRSSRLMAGRRERWSSLKKVMAEARQK